MSTEVFLFRFVRVKFCWLTSQHSAIPFFWFQDFWVKASPHFSPTSRLENLRIIPSTKASTRNEHQELIIEARTGTEMVRPYYQILKFTRKAGEAPRAGMLTSFQIHPHLQTPKHVGIAGGQRQARIRRNTKCKIHHLIQKVVGKAGGDIQTESTRSSVVIEVLRHPTLNQIIKRGRNQYPSIRRDTMQTQVLQTVMILIANAVIVIITGSTDIIIVVVVAIKMIRNTNQTESLCHLN